MLKRTLISFTLPVVLLLGNEQGNHAAASAMATAAKAQLRQNTPESQPARRSLDEGGTGTLEKMIVAGIRSLPFLFLTICCARPKLVPWRCCAKTLRWPGSTPPATAFLLL